MEYKTLICQNMLQLTALETRLNVSSEQGWRLHTAVAIDGRIVVIMERVITTMARYGKEEVNER